MPDIRFTPALPIDQDNNVPLSTILQRNDAVRRQTMETQDMADQRDTADLVDQAFRANTKIDPATGQVVHDRKAILTRLADPKAGDPDALQTAQGFFEKQDATHQALIDKARERMGAEQLAKVTALASIDPKAPPDEFKAQTLRVASQLRAQNINVTDEEINGVTPDAVLQAQRMVKGPKEVSTEEQNAANNAAKNAGTWHVAKFRTTKKNGAATVSEERAVLVNDKTGEVRDGTTHQPIDASTGTVVSGGPAASTPIASGRLHGVTPAAMLTPDGKLDPQAYYTATLPLLEGKWNPKDNNGYPTMWGLNAKFNPNVRPDMPLSEGVDTAIKSYWNKYEVGKIDNPALAAVYADTSFIAPGMAKSFLKSSNGDPQKFIELRQAWEERLLKKGILHPDQANGIRSRTAAVAQLAAGLGGGGAPASAGGAPSAPPMGGGGLAGPEVAMPAYVAPAGSQPILNDHDQDGMAEFMLQTGHLPANFSDRGRGDKEKILSKVVQKLQKIGVSFPEWDAANADKKAAISSLVKLRGNADAVEAFETTANRNLDLVSGLVDKAGTSEAHLSNKLQLFWRGQIKGDPSVTQLNAAVETFIREYAKVSTSTGNSPTSDAAQAHARAILAPYMAKGQLRAGLALLKQEMDNRKEGFESQYAQVRARVTGSSAGGAPGASASGGAPKYQYFRDKNGKIYKRAVQ